MKRLVFYIGFAVMLMLVSAVKAVAATKPRLVVNIVVSSMRADDLERYAKNFSNNGFSRLTSNGQWFTNASYIFLG